MDNVDDLISRNKFDIASIERLNSIEQDEAEPVLESLMEWIQDINWPVAQELIKILPRFHLQLIPVIHNILKKDDDVWKYWTLELLRNFPKKTLSVFQSDLERMVNSPTEGEKIEDVDKSAHELLDSILGDTTL